MMPSHSRSHLNLGNRNVTIALTPAPGQENAHVGQRGLEVKRRVVHIVIGKVHGVTQPNGLAQQNHDKEATIPQI